MTAVRPWAKRSSVTEPRVSVICIFLNGALFIEEAIESVLAQEFTDYELLLVDDGSTDASTAIARSHAARLADRVRYLEHDGHENRGMSASRNLGLRQARGDFVAFIDCDDVWRPAKLREQLALMDRYPDVGLVCGAICQRRAGVGKADRTVRTGFLADTAVTAPLAPLRLYPLGAAPSPVPSDILVRRSVIERVGGFEDQFRGMYEDQAFLAKIYLECPIWFSSRVWLDYRLHSQSEVSIVHRQGRYAEEKRRYLQWYLRFLGDTGFAYRESLERAAKRALWLVNHPSLEMAFHRVRRLWLRFAA